MQNNINKRTFLKLLTAAGLTVASKNWAANKVDFWIRRLNWSGVQFRYGDADLFVDPIFTDIWDGSNKYPFVDIDTSAKRKYVLITHAHGDHFDSQGLKANLGPKDWIICEESEATYIASRGFQVMPVKLYQPIQRRGFTMIPVPANDGLGASQVSWIIMVNGKKYLHCGDTIWHGKWRSYGAVYGPFDAVFLPINGAIQKESPASEIPMSLTPEEAVDAAILVNAKQLVPTHYGLNVPGMYDEVAEPLKKLTQIAERRQVNIKYIKPGEFL